MNMMRREKKITFLVPVKEKRTFIGSLNNYYFEANKQKIYVALIDLF